MRAFQALSRTFRVFAVVAVLLAFAARPAPAQILENYSDSMTTNKTSTATKIQGSRPLAVQRGVTIDGVLRSPPGFPMVLSGNPFENAWTGREFLKPMRLDTGTYAPMDVDI